MNNVGVDHSHAYASATTCAVLLWYQVVLLSMHNALVTVHFLIRIAALKMMVVVRKSYRFMDTSRLYHFVAGYFETIANLRFWILRYSCVDY